MKEEFTTNARRWYDKDPVLSSAMKTLEESDDETQIKVALNLIKIITEHHLSSTEYESVEDIVSATEDMMDESKHGRWYDLDGTLRTAISLLQNCPDSTRSVIAKEMAKNVIDIIKKEEDVDDVELDIPEGIKAFLDEDQINLVNSVPFDDINCHLALPNNPDLGK